MNKCSLIIHGLKQHTASRLGQLTEFLASELQLSSEIVQGRLKQFPVTFKNWIDVDHVPQLTHAFSTLGVIAEFTQADGSPITTDPASPIPPTPTDPAMPEFELISPQSDPSPLTTPSSTPVTPAALAQNTASLEIGGLSWDEAPAEAPQIPEPNPVTPTQTAEPTPDLGLGDLTLGFAEADTTSESFLDKLENMDLSGADNPTEHSTLAAESIVESVINELDFKLAPEEPQSKNAPPPPKKSAAPPTEPTAPPVTTADIKSKPDVPDVKSIPLSTGSHTPEVLIAAVKPSHPKNIDNVIPDDGSDLGPSLLVVLGLVVALLGGGAAVFFLYDADKGSPIIVSNVELLLAQQSEILQPMTGNSSTTDEVTPKTRDIPPDLKRWEGDSSVNQTTVKVTVQVSPSKGVWDLALEIENPEPPKLTAAEIVNKVPARPWIARIESAQLSISVDTAHNIQQTPQKISFQFKDVAKVYLRTGGKSQRLTGELTGRGVLDWDSKEVLGEWQVIGGQPLPANFQNAQRESDGTVSFSYSGPFVARETKSAVNSPSN